MPVQARLIEGIHQVAGIAVSDDEDLAWAIRVEGLQAQRAEPSPDVAVMVRHRSDDGLIIGVVTFREALAGVPDPSEKAQQDAAAEGECENPPSADPVAV